MSERITFRGTVREWIGALWCEYVLHTDPVASKERDDVVIPYLVTYFRLP